MNKINSDGDRKNYYYSFFVEYFNTLNSPSELSIASICAEV